MTPYDERISEIENAIRTCTDDSTLRELSNNNHDLSNQRHGYRRCQDEYAELIEDGRTVLAAARLDGYNSEALSDFARTLAKLEGQ